MKAIRSIIFFILIFFNQLLFAQYYSTGSDPANIKWRQLNSPFFKVVYPENFEAEAKRFIAMLDTLYLYSGHSLNHTPKPISVLIHSHSAYSNGLVSWAPKRMEIYPTANQNIFSQDYLEQLAIHEFRHVVQIDKINQGLTHTLTYPFGQQIVGGVLGLYVPLWFLEGDAVLTETTLSKSGRGRLPSFEQEIRAQLLEKETYPYEKAYFGSYRDFVPNFYRMGFLLAAGTRHKYGPKAWDKALDETARKCWSVTPFNSGIKKTTGKNKVPLYHEIFNDWHQRWKEQDENLALSKINIITKPDTTYKNYSYPVVIDKQHIIAEVSGPGVNRHFAMINRLTGAEEKLLFTGYKNNEPFSYANSTLCWTELEQHPRWENQYFSVIRTYNLLAEKQHKISSKSRYYAPSLSPNGEIIATVYISTNNTKELHLIRTTDGKLIKTITTPNNDLPLTPSWDETGQRLVMILLSRDGKRPAIYNLTNNSWHNLTKPSFAQIVSPKFIGNHVYFSASWSGIDNIYRIRTDGTGLQKVTESRFGATHVSKGATKGSIIYQDYTSDGYQIAQASLDSIIISDYTPGSLPIEPFIKQLQSHEKGIPNLKDLPVDNYTSKKYSKWNLFNFHSWAPVNLNTNDPTLSQGISLMSQNLLSSTFMSFGYNANKQSSHEKYYMNLAYKAWWPVIELEAKAGNTNYQTQGYDVTDTDTFKLEYDIERQHFYADLEINLPLNLTRGPWQRMIQPSVSTGYQYISGYDYLQTPVTIIDNQIITDETETINIDAIHFYPVKYSLFMYNIHSRSERDVTSRWGQVLELDYRHTPLGGLSFGSIFGIHTRLYFPGLIKHHSLRIDNDWQKKKHGDKINSNNDFYYFNDYVDFPRGINRQTNNELYSFKGDYIFPLANPDWNVPGVIYLKRITTNLFFDYSYYTMQGLNLDTDTWLNYNSNLYSLGTEFRAELHPFRFVFPISLGYRYAYLPKQNNHFNEVLLSMNFSGFSIGNK